MVYEISIGQRFDLLTFFYFIISGYLQSDFLQTVTYPWCLGTSLLPLRCALDKFLLSIISKSKSFNCLLTLSIVTFPVAVSDLIIGFDKIIFTSGNFCYMNDFSFNMLFTISDELQEEGPLVPTCKITLSGCFCSNSIK